MPKPVPKQKELFQNAVQNGTRERCMNLPMQAGIAYPYPLFASKVGTSPHLPAVRRCAPALFRTLGSVAAPAPLKEHARSRHTLTRERTVGEHRLQNTQARDSHSPPLSGGFVSAKVEKIECRKVAALIHTPVFYVM